MYDEDDAAYDAYVAERGDPMDTLDQEHEEVHRPVLTVVMTRHDETVEIRAYADPRVLTFTYPPLAVTDGPDAYGMVREVPYGPRQDGSALLLKFINDFEAGSWVRKSAGGAA
jgi:hypothetical protein